MNSYVEICKQKLNAIIKERDSFVVHKEYLFVNIRKRVEEAEHIIVCGLSPLGRLCLEQIGQHTEAIISVFDIRDEKYGSSIPVHKEEKNLYIICSREDAQTYLNLVPRVDSEVLSYNELFLLDEKFSVQNSLLHNQKFVIECMENVFLYAMEYLEMLNALQDVFSAELLAKWLLYRLYLDISLMRNVGDRKVIF